LRFPSLGKPSSLGLTHREAEVLALVAEGRTNRQIGQALFITPKTASVHISRILTKLGSPAAARQPRWRTDSASTSNNPARHWLLSLPRLLGGVRSGRADPSVPRF
jgi:DNA-binding CsgD family transcriptional regulator